MIIAINSMHIEVYKKMTNVTDSMRFQTCCNGL